MYSSSGSPYPGRPIVICIRRIQYASPEYFEVLEVRRKILRAPLGRDYSEEDIAAEAGEFHLGAFFEGESKSTAIGSLLLRPHPRPNTIIMRQVAIDENYQGQGIGRLLVEASEVWSQEYGAEVIVLHARETAIPFYEKLGYSAEGPIFEEVGIPHRHMRKRLSQTS